jgi:hypothetical protein
MSGGKTEDTKVVHERPAIKLVQFDTTLAPVQPASELPNGFDRTHSTFPEVTKFDASDKSGSQVIDGTTTIFSALFQNKEGSPLKSLAFPP